jgi:dTDP-4-dehydrorhamnose 3,5-epimerase-like enzyme
VLKDCKLIKLRTNSDYRGDISFLEGNHEIPFAIKRIYYLYNVPENLSRGSHAHKNLEQLIIPISGSFNITLDDGYKKRTYLLNSPNQGLYVCPMIWRDLEHFSRNACCLVLASDYFSEHDYLRDYDGFIKSARKRCK